MKSNILNFLFVIILLKEFQKDNNFNLNYLLQFLVKLNQIFVLNLTFFKPFIIFR